MAVHLPLTQKAQDEARDLMVTSKNLLAPASGEPIVTPSQDMILGAYYISSVKEGAEGTGNIYANIDDVSHAHDAGELSIHALIKVRVDGKVIETTYGRLLFNEIVPAELGFINETLKKSVLKRILSESYEIFGPPETAKFVNRIKDFGFKYATLSGISIAESDMILPDNKKQLLDEASEKVTYIQKKHWNGFLTADEKFAQSIVIWAEVKKVIESEMKGLYTNENHIFNFIDSWARWNWGNVTQLAGMKWLVASTTGKTIELPIKSTLKEWFSTLEYFSATHGWRKGKSDTALKTAQSGYLTRRLVDSSQNIIIREEDCETVHHKIVLREDPKSWFDEKFEDRIYSHTLARDVKDSTWKVIIPDGTVINQNILELIEEHKVEEVAIRSVLTCETEGGVCQKCYGLDLAANAGVDIGSPVWVIAAQSIGEPGTQLTMRTFHSGWVAKEGWDMTQGLARVEELFEARNPKLVAEISDIDGIVEVEHADNQVIVAVTAHTLEEEEYYFSEKCEIAVKEGQQIKAKQILARNKEEKSRITATFAGEVKKVAPGMIIIADTEKRRYEYSFDLGKTLLVKSGDQVKTAQKMTEWNLSIAKLMQVWGVLAAEKYIVDEIKSIYASQGQTVNSKHIELIVRQMFSRIRVLDKWDTEFFPGDIVDIITFKRENDRLFSEGKKPGIGERLLLGITKISLYTESWLSSASFQETVRVLVESSVSGKIDKLKELKENVIIGRLIPAWDQYKRINGILPEDTSEYFDAKRDERVDISEPHMQEVTKEMEHESDF